MSAPPDPINSFNAFVALAQQFSQIVMRGLPGGYITLALIVSLLCMRIGMRWGYSKREAEERGEQKKFKRHMSKYLSSLGLPRAIEAVPVIEAVSHSDAVLANSGK